MILPGEQIGVLGGGQLGMFFTLAAKKMGYRVVVWDPDSEAPARFFSDRFICASFNDPQARLSFLSETRGVTFEWENVPASLVLRIEKDLLVRPGSAVLRLLQNRATQKHFLHEQGFPVAPFISFHDRETLALHVRAIGLPCIVKTASSGYDGQGQWHLTNNDDVTALTQYLGNWPCPDGWVLEKKINFQQELSVIVVIGNLRDVLAYPVSENIHEQGILRMSRVPAEISPEQALQATSLAKASVGAFKESKITTADVVTSAGVYCVEMFLGDDGGLLINEIAPRPHNSGHYSMDVCSVSQFEQQVRVLCGLPLIAPTLLSPAVLVNILGSEMERLTADVGTSADGVPSADGVTLTSGIRFYHYRKRVIKAGRKMGHLLIIDSDSGAAMKQAIQTLGILREGTAAK